MSLLKQYQNGNALVSLYSDGTREVITNDNTDTAPEIDIRLAKKLGITEEVAEEIAKKNSCQYYRVDPYELNRDLKGTIIGLGGQVIT